ncbi:DUF3224 domain-containing protein [Microbacterium gorillae]|uniref:DUF3224 domain-containing protein n=1 Tax=Microbacterium gorillae TaxID=1231063 RepID=UPI003D961083
MSEERVVEAQFTVTLTPAVGIVAETGRFDMTKEWTGAIRGTSEGVMLSAGDPRLGAAGYVALEVVSGSLDGRAGSFALAQLGRMTPAGQNLDWEIVPGSGTGDLIGLAGTIELLSAEDTHQVRLRYTLPE